MIDSNLRTTNNKEHFETTEKESHLPTLDISCLPNETLAHIFSFSHPLSSILLVNKHWNDLAEAELHRQFPEATRKTNAYFLKFQNHPNGALLVKKRIENITDLKMFEIALTEKNFYWLFRSFRETSQAMPASSKILFRISPFTNSDYNKVIDTLKNHEKYLYDNFVCNLDVNLKILNNELEFCIKNELTHFLNDFFDFFIKPLVRCAYYWNDSNSPDKILFVVKKYADQLPQEIIDLIPNIKLNQLLRSSKQKEDDLNDAINKLMRLDANPHKKTPLEEEQILKRIMELIEPFNLHLTLKLSSKRLNGLIFKLIDADPETAKSIAYLLAEESPEESKLYLEIIESVDQANFKKDTQEFKKYYKAMEAEKAEKEISHEKEQDSGSDYDFFCELSYTNSESDIESETSDTDESD